MPVNCDRPWQDTSNGPCLVGGRSKTDNRIVFPMPDGGEAQLFDPVLLKTKGTLWSYTVQRFPPKAPPYLGVTDPKKFKIFALGYVELEGEVIVESRIDTVEIDSLHIGQKMELVILDVPKGDGQGHFQTHAFRPMV